MSTPSLNAGKRADAEPSSAEKKLPGRTGAAAAAASVKSPAVKSMTGYAEAHSDADGFHVSVSLRSVNHRFLDLRVRLSEGFEASEPAIRELVRDRLRRGHIDITVSVEPVGAATVEVHYETAAAYMRALQELRRDFALTGEPDVVALLRLPGVLAARGRPAGAATQEEDSARLSRQVAACLAQALDRLEEMREAEGRALAAEMHSLVADIGAKTAELESITVRSRPLYALRLKAKLEELLAHLREARGDLPGDHFQEGFIDPSRLAQEAALLAERADVSEELARLRSHAAQFGNIVDGGGQIGKKLDFLLQEMHREANTLLAKTPAVGEDALTVTDLGLQIKASIERLREQVQNVE
jgi:uncharacterized protein (TIGR00255 family)